MNRSRAETLTEDDRSRIAHAMRDGGLRVQEIALADGRVVWLKRVERLDGAERVQKGDPSRAFEAERTALKALAAAGQPVPAILDEGPDYMVLADAGVNLDLHLSRQSLSAGEERQAFAAAGAALAGLHKAGFAHGRPVLRDLCWADGRLTMIDLERFQPRRRSRTARALDLVIFIQGWFSRQTAEDDRTDLLEVALGAYRTDAPAGIWPALVRWTRLLWIVLPLVRLARRLRPASREVQGANWTITYLLHLMRDAA